MVSIKLPHLGFCDRDLLPGLYKQCCYKHTILDMPGIQNNTILHGGANARLSIIHT